MIVDYSPLKHCFDRKPFKQTDPFSILTALKLGCKNFFIADMMTGYWQIRLVPGPNGSYITIFVTERGVFRCKVMPMGIQPASDELSHQMQQLFEKLFATKEISAGSPMVRDLDDFLGGSETEDGLSNLMEKLLHRCQTGRVYLNPSKFNIALEGEPVIFAGIQVSSKGYKMDPARLDSIREFQRPRTKKQLQRWLGLCMSLGQFTSLQLKDCLELQQELLWKNYSNDLQWNQEQVTEFKMAREVLYNSLQMLQPFNPVLAMGLLVDTAKTTGIGYILFQFDPKYSSWC